MPNITKDYYHNIDLLANQLLNGRLHNITTANRTTLGATLTTSDKGYMVYDTNLLTPYFWNGTAWQSAGGGTWGSITGTITAQTDLINYLSGNYYPLSSNPAGYITSAALTPYLTSATAASTYVPKTRTITINGTTLDLSADRSWTISTNPGTVTSVGAGTGMNFTTITSSGNVAIDTTKVPYYASGFSTGLAKWNGTAWTWDTNTYLTAETDPVFTAWLNTPPAISIFDNDAGYLNYIPGINDVLDVDNTALNRTLYFSDSSGDNITSITTKDIQLSDNSGSWPVRSRFTNTYLKISYGSDVQDDTYTQLAATGIVFAVPDGVAGGALATTLRRSVGSGNYTLTLPNVTGTIPISVNGYTANGSGAITIPVGTGTVTSVGLSAGTGISLSGTNPITSSGTITVTNSAPDQTVVLTGGTGISTSGTYPSFTITNSAPDQTVALTAGTGIGVTGTYPNFTITNTGTYTSPLTTKGDIYVRNGSADTRLPVGLDTQVLLADSTTSTGLKWGSNTTPPASGYYGAWQDNVTQTAAVSNTGYAMILRTTDLSNGVTVVTDGTNLTRITFANTGIYNLQFSSQFQNTDNAEHDVTIWIRKNGTDVAGSAGFVTVPKRTSAGTGNEGHCVVGWNYLLSIVGGEYYEIIWSATSTTVTMQYYAAGSPPPSTASVIVTATQQAGIMAGTGMTALNGLSGAVQTFTNDTNVTIVSSGTAHAITWSGTLADGRIASASTWNAKQAQLNGTGFVKASGTTISYDNSTYYLASNPSGYTNNTGTVTSVAALTLGTTGTDLSSTVANGTTTPVITLNVPTASATNRGVLSSTDWSTFNGKQNALTNPVTGTGTNNEIAYFNTTGSTIGSLTTATYPSLTELSYVKGATSSIQTQLNSKLNTTDVSWMLNDAYALMGSGIKSVELACPSLNTAVQSQLLAMANSRMYVAAIYLPKAATITGVKFVQGTTGAYTANNYNGFGLYSYSAGTLTLVASSTNDGNVFKSTANTMISKAFSSTYSAAAGLYYVALLCSASATTTVPSVAAANSYTNVGSLSADFTNSNKMYGSLDAQTSLPGTLALSSFAATATTPIAMFLY